MTNDELPERLACYDVHSSLFKDRQRQMEWQIRAYRRGVVSKEWVIAKGRDWGIDVRFDEGADK